MDTRSALGLLMYHSNSVALNHRVFPGLRHPALLASKTGPVCAPVAPDSKAGKAAQARKSMTAPGIPSQKREDKDSSRPLLRLARKKHLHLIT